jgi:hypothetical protein
MNGTPQRFILQTDQTFQVRPARNTAEHFEEAVRQVCKANSSVLACYLFDIRQVQSDANRLAIALTLENEQTQMDEIAEQFQQMLREFPKLAESTIILSAKPFRDVSKGSAVYVKQ